MCCSSIVVAHRTAKKRTSLLTGIYILILLLWFCCNHISCNRIIVARAFDIFLSPRWLLWHNGNGVGRINKFKLKNAENNISIAPIEVENLLMVEIGRVRRNKGESKGREGKLLPIMVTPTHKTLSTSCICDVVCMRGKSYTYVFIANHARKQSRISWKTWQY